MAEPQIADTEPNDDSDVQLAVLAARTADDKKATDILILEVGEGLAIAGYFVVCSASNPRLVRTVADGGEGYYVQGDHRATIPNLHARVPE